MRHATIITSLTSLYIFLLWVKHVACLHHLIFTIYTCFFALSPLHPLVFTLVHTLNHLSVCLLHVFFMFPLCMIYTILVPCIMVYLPVSALIQSPKSPTLCVYGYVDLAIGSSAIHNTVAGTVIKHIYKYLYSLALACCLAYSYY